MTRSGRKLSADDRVLWSTVARTVTPLRDREKDARLFAELAAAEPHVAEPKPAAAPSFAPRRATPVKPAQKTLDRIDRVKLAKGKVAIDGRIDLHGMTQHDAHLLLLGFLRRARSQGLRNVLVITGKGSSLGSEGALRRAVPHWLATPEFRTLVSGWSEAGRPHGGEGALYVRLTRDRERNR
ncbi:MAG: Smr/MutS family protein [Rhizobiaceae bacterium]|nr:Smr/MutS family protein [Rhizobiaceae bacterium]MCV0404675.1 Smr/MutS family protein [Rhizobiaceae bacterium]